MSRTLQLTDRECNTLIEVLGLLVDHDHPSNMLLSKHQDTNLQDILEKLKYIKN